MTSPYRRELQAAGCHAAWYGHAVLALCEEGEPWDTAPEWQRDAMRESVDFWEHWFVARRRQLQEDPGLFGAELWYKLVHCARKELPAASHAFWMSRRLHAGWTWGPQKDHIAKRHPNLVPYSELNTLERRKGLAVLEAFLAMSTVP